jgi:DNA repair exonuclease SbcCD ATPase subunit
VSNRDNADLLRECFDLRLRLKDSDADLTALRAQLAEAQREVARCKQSADLCDQFQLELSAEVMRHEETRAQLKHWQEVAEQMSAEREHNANQAQAWRAVAERLRYALSHCITTNKLMPILADFDKLNKP